MDHSLARRFFRLLLHVLVLCLALVCSGCVVVYGKRTYREQSFQLVDKKTSRPVSDAKVFIFASQGPEILPRMPVFWPHPGVATTGKEGFATILVPQGPKIELFACVVRDSRVISQISEREAYVYLPEGEGPPPAPNWERRADGVVVLRQDGFPNRELKAGELRQAARFERQARAWHAKWKEKMGEQGVASLGGASR